MTANQINYAKLKEEERSNRAKESLTKEANIETQRSNIAKENISKYGTEESVRHNQVMESLERERNTLNYNASIYSSNVSQRSAELNYAANTYASQLNYATNMANIDLGTQKMWVENHEKRYATDLNYQAQLSSQEVQKRGQNTSLIGNIVNAIGSTVTKIATPILFGKT